MALSAVAAPVPVRASVVVPTRNGGSRVPALLEALAGQRARGRWEVIVVEDGSETVAEPLPAAGDVRVVRQAHRGPGSARNRGAGLATGEFLIFVDDDCRPEPDWLEEMLGPFDDPRVVAVKGAYSTAQRGVVPSFVQTEYEEKYARLARKPYVNFVDGYSAAFRRDAFVAAGGFDESFPLACVEDREFSLRLSRGRGLMVFNPRAVVSHRHVATFAGYAAKKFKYGRWGIRILRDMPAEFVADDHTPHTQRLQVVLAGLLPVVLAGTAWAPLLALAWVLLFCGSSAPLVARAWSRAGWRVGLAALPLVFLRAAGLGYGMAWGLIVDGVTCARGTERLPPRREGAPTARAPSRTGDGERT